MQMRFCLVARDHRGRVMFGYGYLYFSHNVHIFFGLSYVSSASCSSRKTCTIHICKAQASKSSASLCVDLDTYVCVILSADPRFRGEFANPIIISSMLRRAFFLTGPAGDAGCTRAIAVTPFKTFKPGMRCGIRKLDGRFLLASRL